MKPIDYCLFLISYSFVVTAALAALAVGARRRGYWLLVPIAAIVLIGGVVSGYGLEPGRSFPRLVWEVVRRRDLSAALVVVWGAVLALSSLPGGLTGPWRVSGRADSTFPVGRLVWTMLALGITFVSCQAFIWIGTGRIERQPPAYSLDRAFRVQHVADLDYAPIRIAFGAGRLFVCYDYFDEAGDIGGSIVELYPDDPQRPSRVVADSPLLARSYGLAFHKGDLYVSRSGFRVRADRGMLEYGGTGAVTRLSDVDGDGYFEFADDVVTGLPGVRGPETMHQNNGICFDRDGYLYVTCASSANRALDLHPWGGTVLRVSPDFETIEVFVRGLRNPFAIAAMPSGQLLLTDNDVDENPGDKLLQLHRGAHYGHPYVLPGRPEQLGEGFEGPLWVSEKESNVLGFAYCDAPALPAAYRGGLFVADLLQERVLYFGLESSGEKLRVTNVRPLAVIPSPLDVAATPEGDLFVISRNSRKVYRISPVGREETTGGEEAR